MSTVDQIAVEQMADILLNSGCDLDDERAVIRVLNAGGIASGEVLDLSDAAVSAAKKIKDHVR